MKLFKFILVALTVVAVSSCTKNDDDTPQFDFEARLEEEKIIIKEYVEKNHPNMVEDELKRGIWYEILEEGDPESYEYKFNESIGELIIPTLTTNYTGKLLNGTQFDSNSSNEGWTRILTGVIPAWQIAFLPKEIGEHKIGGLTESGLKKGTEILLITPSYYAYGNQVQGAIPANSPLVFTIKVLNIRH